MGVLAAAKSIKRKAISGKLKHPPVRFGSLGLKLIAYRLSLTGPSPA